MTSQRTRDRLIQRLIDQGIGNLAVLDIISNTPRHMFLDEALSHRAYEDTALPIGHGQTLSQPYIVARMTELLISTCNEMHGNDGELKNVLEIGTGSGYQTAVLSQMVAQVWSVERIKPLQDLARQRLRQLGLNNVRYKHADGGFGWPEYGPYEGILSAAAPRTVPPELLKQLAPNGVLVIPVGADEQYLTVVIREGESENYLTRKMEAVRFVPLLSGVTR